METPLVLLQDYWTLMQSLKPLVPVHAGCQHYLRDAQRKILLRAQLQEYVMHFSSWKGIKSKEVWEQHSTPISNCWNIPTAEHIKQMLSGQKRRAAVSEAAAVA